MISIYLFYTFLSVYVSSGFQSAFNSEALEISFHFHCAYIHSDPEW